MYKPSLYQWKDKDKSGRDKGKDKGGKDRDKINRDTGGGLQLQKVEANMISIQVGYITYCPF